jgi:hypothetical protein
MQRASRGAKATEACHALPRSLRRCKASSTLSHHLFTLNHHTARCAARLITLPLSDDTCCGYRGHAAAYRPRLRARCGGSACGSACGCSALAAPGSHAAWDWRAAVRGRSGLACVQMALLFDKIGKEAKDLLGKVRAATPPGCCRRRACSRCGLCAACSVPTRRAGLATRPPPEAAAGLPCGLR